MNDARAAEFDLAGPYLITRQGIMVAANSRVGISRLDDLADMRVCVVGDGSLSQKVLEDNVPKAKAVPEKSSSACVTALQRGNVDAFSIDQAILYGYADQNDQLRVVDGLNIGPQILYGVAFRKEDHGLCATARDVIKDLLDGKWSSYASTRLPKYVAAVKDYQTQLRPTKRDVEENSCKTPARR